jgi:small-conductance mechanosensitive channel
MANGIHNMDDLETVIAEMEERYGETVPEMNRELLRENTRRTLSYEDNPDKIEYEVREAIKVVLH